MRITTIKKGLIDSPEESSLFIIEATPNVGVIDHKTQAETTLNFLKNNLPGGTLAELYKLPALRELVNFANKETEIKLWKSPEQVESYNEICVEVKAPLTSREIETIGGLLGYALTIHVGSHNKLSDVVSIQRGNNPHTTILTYNYDPTDRIRTHDHSLEAFEYFESMLDLGSPIRKTNNAGANTKGTRLVYGLGYIPDITVKVR